MNINNEFESIFMVIDQNLHKLINGDIFRFPGTNAQISLQRYQKILHMLFAINENTMTVNDKHFYYMEIDHHLITGDLLGAKMIQSEELVSGILTVSSSPNIYFYVETNTRKKASQHLLCRPLKGIIHLHFKC